MDLLQTILVQVVNSGKHTLGGSDDEAKSASFYIPKIPPEQFHKMIIVGFLRESVPDTFVVLSRFVAQDGIALVHIAIQINSVTLVYLYRFSSC